MHHLELPSYLEQSDEVRDRFTRLKQRPVVLEVKGLSKEFDSLDGKVLALKDINFKTYKREFVCVIGPSGCGKSTLFNIIGGLIEEYEGPEFRTRLARRPETSTSCINRNAGNRSGRGRGRRSR